MTTASGKVIFISKSHWRVTYEWSIELFLLLAHQSASFEEFKAQLMDIDSAVKWDSAEMTKVQAEVAAKAEEVKVRAAARAAGGVK